MTFGEKLQKLRRESALSQEKLAEQLHVSRQAISKWELGTAAPDTDNIVRLSKFFQVPLEYLMLEDCTDPSRPWGGAPSPRRRRRCLRHRKNGLPGGRRASRSGLFWRDSCWNS